MTIATDITCDVCGATRGPRNHWWVASECRGGAWVDTSSGDARETDQPSLLILPWDDHIASAIGVKHLCGQQCAQVLQSQWMDKVAEATNGD